MPPRPANGTRATMAPCITKLHNLGDEPSRKAWNCVVKTLQEGSSPWFGPLDTGGLQFAEVKEWQVAPMVAIVHFTDKRPDVSVQDLGKMNIVELHTHIAGFVPFSRIRDEEHGTTLILPMGLQKMSSALGYRTRPPKLGSDYPYYDEGPQRLSPSQEEGAAQLPNILGKLMAAIATRFPTMVLLTKFNGGHDDWAKPRAASAFRLWSTAFPHRFVVGWKNYTMQKLLPTDAGAQLSELEGQAQRLNRRYQRTATKGGEDSPKALAMKTELAHVEAEIAALKGPGYDETDERWSTKDAPRDSGPLELKSTERSKAVPTFGAPQGSGATYSEVTDTLQIFSGDDQTIFCIEGAKAIEPIARLLRKEWSSLDYVHISPNLGTLFTCWVPGAEQSNPGPATGFIDM